MTSTVHFVIDFGEVISLAQPRETRAELADMAGADHPGFAERYWQYREAYDRGLHAPTYWAAVAGTDSLNPNVVRECTQRDVQAWTRLHRDTLEVLRQVRATGVGLTLLSNAPRAQADVVERLPELRPLFDDYVFSARLAITKPDPRIYRETAARLPHTAQIVFVDDKQKNLDAARDIGWTGIRFESPTQLRTKLTHALKCRTHTLRPPHHFLEG